MRFCLNLLLALILPLSVAAKTTGTARLENYKDLIEKARNLTLQRDRLQATQILVRGLKKETRTSSAYKELAKTLEELSGLFYTEKGQTLYSLAESVVDAKPREAIENYQAALRVEDGNLTVLKALARAHLSLSECDPATLVIAQAEKLNPVSAELRLLRLQAADCAGRFGRVRELLSQVDVELAPVERFIRGLQIRDSLRRKDVKKARAILAAWEAAFPDYPEVYFWKWKLSMAGGAADRGFALKYAQLCQNLTPRKKKSYSLDLELCKGKEAVEEYLKESGLLDAVPSGESNE